MALTGSVHLQLTFITDEMVYFTVNYVQFVDIVEHAINVALPHIEIIFVRKLLKAGLKLEIC